MSDFAVIKKETIDVVESRIKSFQNNGQLHFPDNYSPQNAMKSAWLILQETVDRSKRPALTVCTRPSIANALLDMVVQGLNPAKKQCYFIVYGDKLSCQRSYFGTMAITKRVYPEIAEIVAETIHEGDEVTIEIDKGRKVITKHVQKFGAVDKAIIGAYCMILREDGTVMRCEVMTINQIKQAWKQSKMNPITDGGEVKKGSTHDKFQTEMAKKTVVNRCCKPLLNSSNDSDLLIEAMSRADEMRADDDVTAEIEHNASTGDVIDIDNESTAEVDDEQPKQEPAQEEDVQNAEPTDAEVQAVIANKLQSYKEMNEQVFKNAMKAARVSLLKPFNEIDMATADKIGKFFKDNLDEANQPKENDGEKPGF